ncbi:YfiR family protein [Steroidobacter sp. S1-65]|uniref:YfiR family protein n=1 Tax=Steroidobacter gossypii TaxID=2805490 RepID=A0ABS1WX28_9GAMM|nr:YfiR family protein [Steroidobacter gossypii]MBM0105497.1 YfiR family protein [Steroidobacter gossypii]
MRWLAWLMFVSAAALAANVSTAPEYSIKAGYILLFTRYVEWPKGAFTSADAPLEICLLGTDPFGSVLDKTMAGQRSQHRALNVRRLPDVQAAQGCHVLFLGSATLEQTRQWLDALAGEPVLTITEDPDALGHGAALCFVREIADGKARIRFDASLPSMQRAGLSASSQMLVAARKVHRDNPGI